jgi:hypothetical protein
MQAPFAWRNGLRTGVSAPHDAGASPRGYLGLTRAE